nr:hypothetical protein [Tanacetum cinerariifolium]
MEAEDDMPHLDGNNKRLRTNDMLDQNQNDFGYCMEQMHQWMEKAKMLYKSKEQNYANLQYNQQLEINQLKERKNMLEIIIKSKDQELETKRAEVFSLERELFLMSDFVSGLKDHVLKNMSSKDLYQLVSEPRGSRSRIYK